MRKRSLADCKRRASRCAPSKAAMQIWQRQFWTAYWIALRRSSQDKRARRSAFIITGLLAYLLAYVSFIVFCAISQGPWAIALWMGILGAAVLVNFLLRRSHREQDDLLRHSLTGNAWSDQRMAGAVSPTVRSYLAERAIIISSLVARAASEIWLHHNQVPEGAQPIARQVQNSFLRDRGLWSTLEPLERDLLSAPNGQWNGAQQNEATTWCEQLRLLRWALGIDGELLPLAHFRASIFL